MLPDSGRFPTRRLTVKIVCAADCRTVPRKVALTANVRHAGPSGDQGSLPGRVSSKPSSVIRAPVVGNGSGSGKSWIGVPEVVVVVELPEGWVPEDWVEMTAGWVVTFPGFVVDEVFERVVVGVDFGLNTRILGTTVVVVAALGAPVVVGVLVPGLAGFVVGGGVATVVVGTAAVSDGWLTEWNGPLR